MMESSGARCDPSRTLTAQQRLGRAFPKVNDGEQARLNGGCNQSSRALVRSRTMTP